MTVAVLGISAYYHDSGAALLVDGRIVAAAQEERFSRVKHDMAFPVNAVRFVLDEAGLEIANLDAIAFYDKPLLKFERLLETYHAFAPRGLQSFTTAIPVWIKEKLFMKKLLRDELSRINGGKISSQLPLLFPEHHLSHSASAFYPSPFAEAAILTIDGVGEWTTTAISYGSGKDITVLRELSFPHSLGLLYSAFTYYLGFRVNSGEYKLMGLAPYGAADSGEVAKYKKLILEHLIDLYPDGSLLLNMGYFDFATGLRMCRDSKWRELFGFMKREPESELGQNHMDLALAIQEVTEEIVLRLARTARALTGSKNLVLAGGVALNCVANGKLLREKVFDNIWIQPAAGDAGGALGAAYVVSHLGHKLPRETPADGHDLMQGCYLGPEYSEIDIKRLLRKFNAPHEYFADQEELVVRVAQHLAGGKIVGWFQGRMEWGPRSLGNRSILGDPRDPGMQKRLNLKIKKREGFRPFAPSVMAEDAAEYFAQEVPSPYMMFVAPVTEKHRKKLPENYGVMAMYERLYQVRSDIPAVTHVDFSARVQTVSRKTNPLYWQLLNEFKKLTGIGMVVNTSFNVRGEPIVCTPEDGYRCFVTTEIDFLAIGNYLISR